MDIISNISLFVNVKEEPEFDDFYQCDFCSSNFKTKEERKLHTTEHFHTKFCSNCNTFLIKIADDWYGQHTETNCCRELKTVADSSYDNTLFQSNPNSIKYNLEESDGEMKPCSVVLQEIQQMNRSLTLKEDADCDPLVAIPDLDQNNIEFTEKIVKNEPIKPKKKPSIRRGNKKSTGNIEQKRELQCDHCNKFFSNRKSIYDHMHKYHTPKNGQRSVTCDTCGASFASTGNLTSHKRTHNETKKFICNYCGRGFNQLYHLNEHINAHEGKKPWICKVCLKGFSRRSHLNAHHRVHTREKPYKCTIEQCERAYMYKIDLNRHKYSVHGIYTKKHICPICSKVYSENKLLRKHLDSHKESKI